MGEKLSHHRLQAGIVRAVNLGLRQWCMRSGLGRVDPKICFCSADVARNEHVYFFLRRLSLREPLAVWFRSADSVKEDVQVADQRYKERVLKADMIGNHALNHGENRASDDRHIQNARSISGERSELRHAQREDGGKHDRVKQADGKNGPHRRVSAEQHGRCDQAPCNNRAQSQQMARSESAEKRSSEKAPYHCATPVRSEVTCRRLRRERRDLRQTEVVHKKTSDGNLRAYIRKDSDRPEQEIRMLPN